MARYKSMSEKEIIQSASGIDWHKPVCPRCGSIRMKKNKEDGFLCTMLWFVCQECKLQFGRPQKKGEGISGVLS